jgi:hypothetical protein
MSPDPVHGREAEAAEVAAEEEEEEEEETTALSGNGNPLARSVRASRKPDDVKMAQNKKKQETRRHLTLAARLGMRCLSSSGHAAA